jgi:hypothetical protein
MNTRQSKSKNVVKTVSNGLLASGRKLIAGIEQAKWHLTADLGKAFQLPERLFRVAVNEAEALAWQTEYPHLVFPALAAEKVLAASAWYDGRGAFHGVRALAA